jgi:hypothetical protein
MYFSIAYTASLLKHGLEKLALICQSGYNNNKILSLSGLRLLEKRGFSSGPALSKYPV